jgi:hypothetical protein
MTIFRHIDRDKAVGFLAFYWWVPFRCWFVGIPEEPMFIHELLKRSTVPGRPWDIGLRSRVPIVHSLALLHQRGNNRSDQYGSDFALTIDVKGSVTLRKTALFQTKVGDNHSATIERHQLDAVLAVPEFARRGFTMALDRPRRSIRIQSVDVLSADFAASKQKTRKFDTTEWLASSDWIVRWFECDVGRPSSALEGPSIEALLSRHIADAPGEFPGYMSDLRGRSNASRR